MEYYFIISMYCRKAHKLLMPQRRLYQTYLSLVYLWFPNIERSFGTATICMFLKKYLQVIANILLVYIPQLDLEYRIII